jgi:putative copper export protein
MALLARLTLLAALLAPPSPVNFWVMLALFKTLLAPLSNAAHSSKASTSFPVSPKLSVEPALLIAQSVVPRAPP